MIKQRIWCLYSNWNKKQLLTVDAANSSWLFWLTRAFGCKLVWYDFRVAGFLSASHWITLKYAVCILVYVLCLLNGPCLFCIYCSCLLLLQVSTYHKHLLSCVVAIYLKLLLFLSRAVVASEQRWPIVSWLHELQVSLTM